MHRFFPLVLATLLLVGLLAVTGCRQTRPASNTQSSTPTKGGAAALSETDPRQMRLSRVDMLITQWDAAQAGGRIDQAQALFQRVRCDVDAAFCDFVAASRGKESVSLRYLGTSALGFSARSEATQVLIERLDERDQQLVGNALIALKLRADPCTPLEPLLRHVVNPACAPRRYAPLAIANVVEARYRVGRRVDVREEKAALHVLSGVVADRDPYVRLHVAKALGAFRAQACYELLMILMRDTEIRIRIAAAAGLERLGDHRGFPEVIRLLEQAPLEAKPAVRDVLASYAGRLQGGPLPPSEVQRLGTNTIKWSRWFNDLCRRRGLSVADGRAPGTPAPPGSAPPPGRSPPPRSQPAPPARLPAAPPPPAPAPAPPTPFPAPRVR